MNLVNFSALTILLSAISMPIQATKFMGFEFKSLTETYEGKLNRIEEEHDRIKEGYNRIDEENDKIDKELAQMEKALELSEGQTVESQKQMRERIAQELKDIKIRLDNNLSERNQLDASCETRLNNLSDELKQINTSLNRWLASIITPPVLLTVLALGSWGYIEYKMSQANKKSKDREKQTINTI